jgi:enoyl-CoA hydratase
MITETLILTELSSKILGGKFRDKRSFRDHEKLLAVIGSRRNETRRRGYSPREEHMTDPAQRFVRRREADGVVMVELVGAKSMNILGSAAIHELTAEFHRLAREDDCGVVVLRGAGDRAFIGGADIGEMAGLDQAAAEDCITRLAALCEAVRACPAPVIARLSGWCLGAGLEVAVSCDLRVAGLVHDVAPDDELDARIARLAARLAGLGPQAVRRQKRLLNEWTDTITARAVESRVAQFGLAFRTGEPEHYMTRFTERQAARGKQQAGLGEPEQPL